MRSCHNCGKIATDCVEFCSECGSPLDEAALQGTCPCCDPKQIGCTPCEIDSINKEQPASNSKKLKTSTKIWIVTTLILLLSLILLSSQ